MGDSLQDRLLNAITLRTDPRVMENLCSEALAYIKASDGRSHSMLGNLTEDDIARIIRDVENGGQYIHGMMPEAAARAIVMTAVVAKRDPLVEALEFYANNFVDGGSKARMALDKVKPARTRDQGGECDLEAHLRIVAQALERGVRCSDWNIVCEGIALLEQAIALVPADLNLEE